MFSQLKHAAGVGLSNGARCRSEEPLLAIHGDRRRRTRQVINFTSLAFLFHVLMGMYFWALQHSDQNAHKICRNLTQNNSSYFFSPFPPLRKALDQRGMVATGYGIINQHIYAKVPVQKHHFRYFKKLIFFAHLGVYYVIHFAFY